MTPDESQAYIGRVVTPKVDGARTGRKKRKAAGGRFGELNRFVDLTLRQLKPTAAVVWLILFRDTKPDGLVRTSQTDLARRSGRSVRTVYSALRKLHKLKLLIVVRKGGLNAGPAVHRLRPTVQNG